MLDRGSQFLAGCWPEAALGSLPCKHPPFCRLLYQLEQGEKAVEFIQTEATAFYNPVPEVTSHHLAIPCWLEAIGRSSPHSRGGDHVRACTGEMEIIGVILEATPTSSVSLFSHLRGGKHNAYLLVWCEVIHSLAHSFIRQQILRVCVASRCHRHVVTMADE